MGRHAGWIAAAGGMASTEDNELPIVILFPEIDFDQDKFLATVKEKVETFGYVSIVVSEGVKWPDGRFLAEQGTRDSFGHAQLGGAAPVVANMVKDALGYKFHWAVADYLQRAGRHLASKSDVEQAYAMGQAAVELALAGKNAVMPTIVRTSDAPYAWEVGSANLADVANVEKMMPREFITEDGFGITSLCRDYLQPLITGEDYPPYKNGLPDYVVLKKMAVARQLSDFVK
jgi:6-phosphofructokinase 1